MSPRQIVVAAAILMLAAPNSPAAQDLPLGSLDPHSAAALAGLPDAIGRGDFPKTTSVLIVRHGRLVYERYFGEGSIELLNDTRSATKSVTSLAVGAAIADGAIASADAPAFAFLADRAPFKNDAPLKKGITLADLLTMSSALDCDDDDDKSPGNENNMHPQPDWTRWAADLPIRPDWRRDETGRGPFHYCTAGAFLLGQIVQRAVHAPVDQYIERRLLRLLGITKDEWPRSPSGEVMTGGGLRLRSRDLAKLAWMLADAGKWNGETIVPASWIADAFSVHRKANAEQNYGYLFWQRRYATGCGTATGWSMGGNGGNAVLVFKELDAAVVVTRRNYNAPGMHRQTADLIERYVLPALACAGR